ncbi:MAG: glutamyl-tRNA reductase [Deltaproteobacteria bacterium]|nr:glutamyl-tRNA reductase [Deltaproteobacteria bacterium]
MNILISGVDHKTAPVEIREKLAQGGLESRRLLNLLDGGLATEGLILSTCNRLEIALVCEDLSSVDQRDQAAQAVVELMAETSRLNLTQLLPYVHRYNDLEAVEYLFRVASGLDSQILGEPQILGQVKQAFREAIKAKIVGPVIHKLFHKSFRAAKRIRNETDLSNGVVSVASAAVEMALRSKGDLAGLKALVVGAGEMATLAVNHLKDKGVTSLTVVSRVMERAFDLAQKVGAKAASLEDLPLCLARSDLILTAVAVDKPLITKAMIEGAKGAGELLILDLGLPRNVEGEVSLIPEVKLLNLDDFEAVVFRNQSFRLMEAQRAEVIIKEEVAKFSQWLSSLGADSTIKDLIALAERARQVEIERTISKHDFNSEQVRSLEVMSRALVRRILHNPVTFAKSCHRHGRCDYNLDSLRRIFGLDGLKDTF